jgi:hypothetical protein
MAKVNREAELQQENESLRAKLAEQETIRETATAGYTKTLQSEINKIRNRGKSTVNTIVVKESHDHKNISLWTAEGERLGPFHPDNAEKLFTDLTAAGVRVSADKPTQEQIDEYKKTDEYKRKKDAFDKKRAIKDKSRKAGAIERLAEKIAAMTGQQSEAINKILKPSEVQKLSEVRA